MDLASVRKKVLRLIRGHSDIILVDETHGSTSLNFMHFFLLLSIFPNDLRLVITRIIVHIFVSRTRGTHQGKLIQEKVSFYTHSRIDDGNVSVLESDNRLQVPTHQFRLGGRREEAPEGAGQPRLSRLPVALVVDAQHAVERAVPGVVEGHESQLKRV